MADKPWIGARLAFQGEPNKPLNGRAIPMNMGKVLGGGSSINVMHGCGSAITDIQPRAGKRLSVFRSYAFPYMDRPNLTVLTHALVTRLIFEGRRVTGVICNYDGQSYVIGANVEVVLSLGAIHTPKVLVQSGIGDGHNIQ